MLNLLIILLKGRFFLDLSFWSHLLLLLIFILIIIWHFLRTDYFWLNLFFLLIFVWLRWLWIYHSTLVVRAPLLP